MSSVQRVEISVRRVLAASGLSFPDQGLVSQGRLHINQSIIDGYNLARSERRLLEQVWSSDEFHSHAVSRAVRDGDLAGLELVISDESRVVLEEGLWTAASFDRAEMIRPLLDHGAQVDVGVSLERSPLFDAAYHGHLSVAVVLLDAGADPNKHDPDDFTPLIETARRGHVDMIRLLLRRGAAIGGHVRDTAEDLAREFGHPDCAQLLAAVRCAGDYKKYVSEPRRRLFVLRALCERGRAQTADALLARLFPWHSAEDAAPAEGRLLKARTATCELPKEIFWHLLAYWRNSRAVEDALVEAAAAY